MRHCGRAMSTFAKVLAALCGVFALAAAGVWQLSARGNAPIDVPAVASSTAERGAYLARVGNCAGCHTVKGGLPYAGGMALDTPFGAVHASNLTPDVATGIGNWSRADFWRAMHHGKSKDEGLKYSARHTASATCELYGKRTACAVLAWLTAGKLARKANSASESSRVTSV